MQSNTITTAGTPNHEKAAVQFGGILESLPIDTHYYYATTKSRGLVSPYFDNPESVKKWRDQNQIKFDERIDCWRAMSFI